MINKFAQLDWWWLGKNEHEIEIRGRCQRGVSGQPIDGAVVEGTSKAGELLSFAQDPLTGQRFRFVDEHG